MQSILEKACQTLAGQTAGSAGIEGRGQELSELATKVSNDCLSSPCGAANFPSLKEIPLLCAVQSQILQQAQLTNCSVDSCLTSNGVREDVRLQQLSINCLAQTKNFKAEHMPSTSPVKNDSERNSISGGDDGNGLSSGDSELEQYFVSSSTQQQ